ncbi:hypothetical protein KC845_04095 [Candidatus Kaiserbacteria bacterium]|nr:hypothetical protein [Candidatus Kaiserbacteria bacterium]
MKKILVTILGIALVLGISAFYWKHTETSSPQPIYELDGTTDTLADGAWSYAGQLRTSPIQNDTKSFTSSSLGISLQYPADWLLFENEHTESGQYHQSTLFIVPQKSMLESIKAARSNFPHESPLSVVITFSKNVDSYTLEEWLATGYTNYEPEYDETLVAKEIDFNGLKAMQYNSNFGLRETDYIAFIYKDWTVFISSASELEDSDVNLIINSIKLAD